MTKYEKPEMTVMQFDTEDILTVSGAPTPENLIVEGETLQTFQGFSIFNILSE